MNLLAAKIPALPRDAVAAAILAPQIPLAGQELGKDAILTRAAEIPALPRDADARQALQAGILFGKIARTDALAALPEARKEAFAIKAQAIAAF